MTVPLGRVVAAELYKVRSIRSYRLSVAAGAAAVVVAAALMAWLSDDPTGWATQPVALPLEYFAYVMMILGVLMVTSEVSSGTAAITASLVPLPRRLALGKYLAGTSIALVSALAVSALVLAVAVLGASASVGDLFTTGPITVASSGLGAVVIATVLGAAFGSLLRSGATAITVLLLWSFVIETILIFVIPVEIGAFLPFKTFGGSRLLMDELGAGVGLAIFALFTAVVVALAALAETRRDAPRI